MMLSFLSTAYQHIMAERGAFLFALVSFAFWFLVPLNMLTWREVVFAVAGFFIACINPKKEQKLSQTPISSQKNRFETDMDMIWETKDVIRTIDQLREVLPSRGSGSNFHDANKVITYLDDQMIYFIQQSPFLQLSTSDGNGVSFISPKGDEPGFVTIIKDSSGRGKVLIIPDRPGNRLVFGLQNLLENPNISILFEIPGTCTTIRCGGIACISKEARLLQDHVARRTVPKVVILVHVQHAFFHCSKAYMRSKLWDPSSWPKKEFQVRFGEYFSPKDSEGAKSVDQRVMDTYAKVQLAIDGHCEEE